MVWQQMTEAECVAWLSRQFGKFIMLQCDPPPPYCDQHLCLLLINLLGDADLGWVLTGYEDGELSIDGPITVPLATVVDCIGEDE